MSTNLMVIKRSLIDILQKPLKKLEYLKMWVCSGEALSISLAEEFYKYFSERDYFLCNFYGSTEIMGDVTYYILPGLKELRTIDKVPIGKYIMKLIPYYLQQNQIKREFILHCFLKVFRWIILLFIFSTRIFG